MPKLVIKIFVILLIICIYSFFAYQELTFVRHNSQKDISNYIQTQLKNYNVTVKDNKINTTKLDKEHRILIMNY